MDDELDDLPPPPRFRPWQGSGVPQPGADRPRVEAPAPAPPSDAPSGSGMRAYPSSAYALQPGAAGPAAARGTMRRGAPTRPGRPSGAVRTSTHRIATILLALAAGATAWLPWLKAPVSGLFDVAASDVTVVHTAWDLPARVVWSYHAPPGGPSLGWLVVGVAVVSLLLGFLGGDWARLAERLVAAAGAVVALLFLIQIARLVQDAPRAPLVDVGMTDFVGLGAYALLVLSFGLLVAPRR